MGDQPAARIEYAKAIEIAPGEDDQTTYALQSATTWVREKKYAEADKAFIQVATQADSKGLYVHEASAYRMMAMYQEDDNVALKHLEKAETSLAHQQGVSLSDREEERSQILLWRAVRADHAKNHDLAQAALDQLKSMANNSRSDIIQHSYHAAAGEMEFSKSNYGDAISQLEENPDDPFSMDLLARAYSAAGRTQDALTVDSKLRAYNFPTIQQALVDFSDLNTNSPEKNFIRGSWRPKHGQL
jgi:tetratricopeptide (TPR) repeat protein